MLPTVAEASTVPGCCRSKLRQYLVTISVTLMAFGAGAGLYCLQWVDFLLLKQALQDYTHLLFSMPWTPLYAAVGALVAGPLLQELGRRRTLLLTGPFFVVGFAMLVAFGVTVWYAHFAQFMIGFPSGVVFVTIPIYIAEVAEDCVRAEMGAFFQVMFLGGWLFASVVNLTDSYTTMCACCLPVPVLAMVVLYRVPESPHYLLARGRKEEAANALQRLRDERHDVSQELESLQAFLDETSRPGSSRFQLNLVTIKALAISLVLFTFHHFNIICRILFVGGIHQYPVVMDAAMVVVSYMGSHIVDRLRRRVLLLVSGCIMTCSLALLGFYVLITWARTTYDAPLWVMLPVNIAFMVAFHVSFGPLPWTFLAELLPPGAKVLGGSFCMTYYWIINFFLARNLEDIIEIPIHNWSFFFFVFSLCCLLATLFVYYFVPETKGKSLHRIQKELANKINEDVLLTEFI